MLIVVIVLLAFVLVSPGYSMYFVRSGSMIPTLNLGDMVITGPVGGFLTGSVKPGAIITFQQNKNVVTHRAVSVSGDSIITKGDNNEDPDPNPVSMSKVVGIYLFKVPFIGYLLTFIRSKPGWFLLIIIPTAILLGFLIKDILKEAFSDSSKTKSKDSQEATNM